MPQVNASEDKAEKNESEINMPVMGQKPLMTLMKALGYETEEGVCLGESVHFLSAVLLGKLNHFIGFRDFITTIPAEDIVRKINRYQMTYRNRIKSSKKGSKELTDDERTFINILARLDTIQIYQHTASKLHMGLAQTNILELSQLVQSIELEKQGGLARLYLDQFIYTPLEWCSHFEMLRIIFEKNRLEKSTLAGCILLRDTTLGSIKGHTIEFTYHPDKCWFLYDANLFPVKVGDTVKKKSEFLNKMSLNTLWTMTYYTVNKQISFNPSHIGSEPDTNNIESLRTGDDPRSFSSDIIRNEMFVRTMKRYFPKSKYISAEIQIFTTQYNPNLAKLKKCFDVLKRTPAKYCPSLLEMAKRKTTEDNNLVHLAAYANDPDKINALKTVINLNDKNNENGGLTPLHIAALGHFSTVAKILEFKLPYKLDLNPVTELKATPALLAARDGNPCLELLNKAGADLQMEDVDGFAAIHMATSNGSVVTTRILLESKKINIEHKLPTGRTSLSLAAQNDHPDIIRLLAEYKANLFVTANDGYAPIHETAKFNSSKALKVLMEYKIDLEQKLPDGSTAAHIAAQYDHDLVLHLLVKEKAKLDSQNNQGKTPLHIAAKYGSLKVIEVLANQVDFDIESSEKLTAVFEAVKNNQVKALQALIYHGANFQKVIGQELKTTALHWAAYYGHIDCVRVLLGNKAIIIEDSLCHTPLYYALSLKHWKIAALLFLTIPLQQFNREDKILIAKNYSQFPDSVILLKKLREIFQIGGFTASFRNSFFSKPSLTLSTELVSVSNLGSKPHPV